jgi:hypothetical protein
MNQRSSCFSPLAGLALVIALSATTGCMTFLGYNDGKKKSLDDLTAEDGSKEIDLVGKYTHPYGMEYVKIESVGLVTGLAGTGEDPPATPQRSELLAEMKQRQVENPNEVLASLDTAIVVTRAFIRPGAREGDRLDIEVRVPTRSETTSLRGGWLRQTRMSPLAVLGGGVRSGHVMAVAEGPILVDPQASGKEGDARAVRGRVLGGGRVTKARPLGLVIDDRFKSFNLSIQIANALNARFFTRTNGRKQGVANPKTDEFIEVTVADRYRENVGRYMQVLRCVAVGETARERQARMARLSRQLMEPVTAGTAALQLEAIGGDEAAEILQRGLESPSTEVRFYSAEALAYLDKTAAVDELAAMARNEPAFRINALAALSAMDDLVAYEALRDMLSVSSAETRYGAFRALWNMNSSDPFVSGEEMNGFTLHVLPVGGPPMVHVTNSFRPEIVIFGQLEPLKTPLLVEAGGKVLVNGLHSGRLTVSRFGTGSAEQREIEPDIEQLIRTIVDLGGTYPDVVQALQLAKAQGAMTSRLDVDALPKSGRPFQRTLGSDESEEGEDESVGLATPLPDLFKRGK